MARQTGSKTPTTTTLVIKIRSVHMIRSRSVHPVKIRSRSLHTCSRSAQIRAKSIRNPYEITWKIRSRCVQDLFKIHSRSVPGFFQDPFNIHPESFQNAFKIRSKFFREDPWNNNNPSRTSHSALPYWCWSHIPWSMIEQTRNANKHLE